MMHLEYMLMTRLIMEVHNDHDYIEHLLHKL